MHHPGDSADGKGWPAGMGVKGGTKVKLMLLKQRPGEALLELTADTKPQVDPGNPAQHLVPESPGLGTAGGSPDECAMPAVCGITGFL